jgi:flagellar biosynthesis chaperone FliJ
MQKKTEFTDIIKIEKNKLQKLEKQLKNEFSIISQANKMIETMENEILKIDYPISGNFSTLQQYNLAMHNMKGEIVKLETQRVQAQNRIIDIRENMKLVNMELEKFKYLEDEVLKQRSLDIQKKESKELDEIATILFSINQKRSLKY